ncbi:MULTISPECIES: hypothetical protein [Helicobacter]|uniref:hypothetical protein n=1 Tax=Helicobacter TaxID=209 RepID=UPI00262B2D7A|nr:hypothetical protein [Helicobacter sp. UBA3407]
MNPHSTKDRIQNHLAYKLGLCMIAFNKIVGGGGQDKQNSLILKIFYFPSFLFNLFKIIQLHKAKKRKYNEIIEIFPSLKYPPLQSCKDYPESLSYKYHLAYLLGEALLQTNKTWYRGSYFTLHKKIQKAKEKYQEISYITKELKAFNQKLYEQIDIIELANSSQEIYSLLQTYKDYPPLLQTLFLNFSFFMQYPNEILQWLNSKEFKEQYIKTNHSYPPLLNPDRLNAKRESKECNVESQRENRDSIQPYPNLSYESIPAELAWDLNLPLPRNYCGILVFFLD